MIEYFLNALQSVDGRHIGIAVFFLMATNGFASTPPSEFVWVLAGLLARENAMPFVVVLAMGVFGNVFGTSLLYFLARHYGDSLVQKLLAWNPVVSSATIDEVFRAFERHGNVYVAVGRCIPNVRSIISIPAGMSKMSFGRFFVFSTVGCAIWGVIWGGFGWLAGPHALDIVRMIDIPLAVLSLVIILVLLGLLYCRVRRKINYH